jgi:enamine deaminase RidA (YjgF/YER057c/UK114 family)
MIQRQITNQRMSQIVEYPLAGTMVALSGQVSDDPSGSIEEQTRDVLGKIDRLLETAGTDKSRVINAYVWLPNVGDFDAMNSVYDAWVAPGHAPARACVEGRLAHPGLKIEIQVFALKP